MSDLTGATPTRKDLILKEEIFILFLFDLIKISVLQRPLQRKRPQSHLLNKQVKLSPGVLWVDELTMGSNISQYMLRRWDENPSLAICGVYGETTLIRYSMG